MTDRDSKFDDLSERVEQFKVLKLPGQPMLTHMGTMYLVLDLWAETQLWRERWEAERADHEATIKHRDDAL